MVINAMYCRLDMLRYFQAGGGFITFFLTHDNKQQIKTHFKIIHVSKILVTQKDLPIPFRCKQTLKINNNNNSNDKNKKKR